MGMRRDDFTQDTIRRAGQRVGYRCSFPGCRAATVGPSMENDKKVSITGVAAHICAASEGGPRYDASMSHEDRKSINNCIWLCQTHAHLIDTDVITYTVDKLRAWKVEAEKQAAAELADIRFFSEYYKINQNNMAVITQIFDNLIIDGQYDQLSMMLGQYRLGSLSEVYDEFVLRYKIYFDVYCCRSELHSDLEKYRNLPCKNGIEEMAKLFISFLLCDELASIFEYCTDEELQKWSDYCISGKLDSILYNANPEQLDVSVSEGLNTTVLKTAANILREKGLINVKTADGGSFEPYGEEFFYRIIKYVYILVCAHEQGEPVDSLICKKEFIFITDSIKKIVLLDCELQEYIWANLLNLLSTTTDTFIGLLDQCPHEVKERPVIRSIVYQNRIFTNIDQIDVDDISRYCEQISQYRLLYQYLNSINKEAAVNYLKNHAYLLSKSSLFLLLVVDSGLNSPADNRYLLLEHSENYSEDILFNCLLTEMLQDESKIIEKFKWLETQHAKMDVFTVEYYLRALHRHKQWDTIMSLSGYNLPILFKVRCVEYLSNSEVNTHLEWCKQLGESLKAQGVKNRWLDFCLGNTYYKLGYLEAAKRSFQNEYDSYGSVEALTNLISLRYETNEFIEDGYFFDLKKIDSWQTQNLIAAIYFKKKNYPDARKHFIRSLLLSDKDNPSAHGLLQIFLHRSNKESPDRIEANSISVLANEKNQCKLALHSPEILDHIIPNNLADCIHLSVEDPSVSPLLYCSVGDSVQFKGQEFIVESISSVDDWLFKYVFSVVVDNPETITIHGDGAENLISKITEVLKASSDSLEDTVSSYNSLKLRSPLTNFSKAVGKSMINTCEFLCYGNSSSIRNNCRLPEVEAPIFVLAYDSIVLLCHMNFDLDKLKSPTFVCAAQVKNQLINDIDEELRDLGSKNHGGLMFYENGSIRMIEQTVESSRDRHSFLTKMKTFVNRIGALTSSFDYSPTSELTKKLFAETKVFQGLLCETGTLGLAQNTNNAIIVTDDEFLFNIASTENIPNVGLLGLMSDMLHDWRDLLKLSRQLHDFNFLNYLPFSLYQKMVDALIEKESDTAIGSREISTWIVSDTEGEPTERHEDVILNLFLTVCNSGEEYLDPDAFLGRTAINITERRNPGFIRHRIEEIFHPQD